MSRPYELRPVRPGSAASGRPADEPTGAWGHPPAGGWGGDPEPGRGGGYGDEPQYGWRPQNEPSRNQNKQARPPGCRPGSAAGGGCSSRSSPRSSSCWCSCSVSSPRAGSSPGSSTPAPCRRAWRRCSPTTTRPTASRTSAARRTCRSRRGATFTCDAHDRRRPRHDPDHGDRRPRRLPGGAAGLSGHPVRALADGELRAANDLFGGSLHHAAVDDAQWARRRGSYTPGRTFGVFDPDGRLVGTTMSFPSRTAVPGGAVLPLAAVTRVGVRADRTRRGLATALMRAQLDDLRARGDVLALLWAIESGIYGRYGYGVATRGRTVRVRASRAALRPQAPAGGTVRRARPRTRSSPCCPAVHDTLALRRPGGITRTPGWWEVCAGPPRRRRRCSPPCTRGQDGRRRVRRGRRARGRPLRRPAGRGYTLRVEDLHAADTAAAAGCGGSCSAST